MMSFADRVVVVTGGAGALGRVACASFAARGGRVLVADRSVRAAQEVVAAIGRGAAPAVGDASSPEGARGIMDEAVRRFGRLDVLVNIAGVQSKERIEDITPEHWDATLRANLTSTFMCSQAAVAHMCDGGGGKIVNMSSFAINSVPWFRQAGQGRSAYAAAKAGVIGLTRTMAAELAAKNINVNVVVPGPIRDPEDIVAINGLEANPAVLTPPLSLIPKGRYGTAQDVANAILFFASDEADYITGEALSIAGGL